MILVYLSLTGNVKSFVKSTGMNSIELVYSSPLVDVNESFVLIIPSYDQEITEIASDFISYKDNLQNLVGVVGSGNTNFDKDYCFNAKEVSKKFSKPLIFTFEFSGTDQDISKFKEELSKFEIT